MTISAVVLAKNEEKNIEECLKSLSWCDELIVVDDESTDSTVAKARKLGAKVYIHTLENDFAKQRNYGLDAAKGDWVLFVDADERVNAELAEEIQKVIENPAYDEYYLHRLDSMWGKVLRYGEAGSTTLLRLARKNEGQWQGRVHEIWNMKGAIGILKNPLCHFPHPTVDEFIREINFYTTLRAQELFQSDIKVRWWEIVVYPNAKFVTNYFLKLGFLDGTAGLLVALLMSFHSFLVRGKLWLLWSQKI